MEPKKEKLTFVEKKTVLFLLIATGITCVIVFWKYIFGNQLLVFQDIGSDTAQLYLSQYASIIRKLQSGDFSFWDANNGFGASLFMYNMSNPVLLIVYLIGTVFGNEAVPYLMVYVMIGEILSSGFCAYLYLSVFPLEERAKGIASYMYAFNGFLIVWGQHYQFGAVCILLPLLLWVIERCLKDKRKWPSLIILTALCALNSMYLAYMSMIVSALYVLVRCLMKEKRFLSWLRHVLTCAWPMIVGLLIGMVNILPTYAAISSVSSRLGANGYTINGILAGFRQLYVPEYYNTILTRFVSSAGRGVSDFGGYLNYYEAPAVFFTALFIILLFQYLFMIPSMKVSVKNRIVHYAVFAAASCGLIFIGTGIVFNGFTAPFSRFTFLYMPYFLGISAMTLHRIFTERKLNFIALALAAAFLIWQYALCYTREWHNSKNATILLLFSALAMCLAFLLYRFLKKENLRKIAVFLLMLAVIANAMIDTYVSFSNRVTLTKTDDAYVTSMYDEDIRSAIAYLKETDDQWYRIEKTFGATQCMDGMIQGYHPVSSYNSTQNQYIVSYIENYWPSLVYRDQNHLCFALGTLNEAQTALTGVKYIIAKRANQNLPGYEAEKSFGPYTLFKSASVINIGSYYDEGSYTQDADSVSVEYADRDQKAVISMPDTGKSGKITATVTAGHDGLFFASVPYEEGWSITVDGQKAEPILAEDGFLSVKLASGTHTVVFSYESPMFAKSCILSAAGLGIFILAGVISVKRRRKLERSSSV